MTPSQPKEERIIGVPSNPPRASMEGLRQEFINLTIHSAEACGHEADIAFAIRSADWWIARINALLKEAEERVIRHLEEDRWTHHKLDHSFRSEFNIQEDLESEINRLCMQSHNGMVDQAIKITKASLTEPSR